MLLKKKMAASTVEQQSVDVRVKGEHYSSYYQLFFPYDLILRFLFRNVEDKDDIHLLSHREISADYRTTGIVESSKLLKTRWKSFKSLDEFKGFLSTPYGLPITGNSALKKALIPLGRIHLGAHYNLPCNPKTEKVIPEFKEFVVDVDLSDYDNIRTCCSGKTLCSQCWIFVKSAAMITPIIMKLAFGYSNVLWFFSGCRGIHGWFYDEDIHLLPQQVRESMILAINFIDPQTKRLDSTVKFSNNIALAAFTNLIGPFCELLIVQHLLIHEKGLAYFKQIINPNFFAKLISIPKENEMERVEKLCEYLSLDINRFLYFKIVLELLYPRFDVNVTADITHLIGCPFAAHMLTGNITIPIEPETFDLNEDVINISSLFDERKKTIAHEKLKNAMKKFELILSL